MLTKSMNLLTFIDRTPDNSLLMPRWFYYVLAVCVVALTAALVAAIVAVARAIRRTERVMAVVEQELERDVPPLLVGLRELTDELRLLSHGATAEMDRIGQLTGRVQEVADGAAGLLTALSGLTRAGQLVGIVAGVKAFVDVFFHRLRKQRGDAYE
jgi:hypothetical protein